MSTICGQPTGVPAGTVRRAQRGQMKREPALFTCKRASPLFESKHTTIQSFRGAAAQDLRASIWLLS
jgi:hypothetical protein